MSIRQHSTLALGQVVIRQVVTVEQQRRVYSLVERDELSRQVLGYVFY